MEGVAEKMKAVALLLRRRRFQIRDVIGMNITTAAMATGTGPVWKLPGRIGFFRKKAIDGNPADIFNPHHMYIADSREGASMLTSNRYWVSID